MIRIPHALLCAAALALATPALADDPVDIASGAVDVSVKEDDKGVTHVDVKAVVEAPPAKLWKIISDCASYSRTMHRTKAAEFLVKEEDGAIVCRVTIEAPWPLDDPTSITRARHTVSADRWERAWKLVEGDYDVNEGSWTLTPYKGDAKRTFVRYQTHVKTRSAVPGGLQRWAQRRELPKVIERLREEVAKL